MLLASRYTQRRLALREANRVRTARAGIKADLKAGRVHIQDLLRDPPEEIASALVGKVLGWAPWIGPVKVNELLRGEISHVKAISLANFTGSQRDELIRRLDSRDREVLRRRRQDTLRGKSSASAKRETSSVGGRI